MKEMNIEAKLTLTPQDVTEIILEHLRKNFTNLKFENVHYKIKEVSYTTTADGKEHKTPILDRVEIDNVKVALDK
jgi:uncharacterized protein YdaL